MVVVNLHPSEWRDLEIQGGAFGEHQIKRIKQVVHYPHQFHTVEARSTRIRLAPAAVGRLEVELQRYHNGPTYAFPWHQQSIPVSQESGR